MGRWKVQPLKSKKDGSLCTSSTYTYIVCDGIFTVTAESCKLVLRIQCSAEHLVSICSMSSSPTPHSGHIGSTRPFQKRCLSFCTKYVPVNILHFVIPFLISATFDGNEVQTRCVEPTFRSLVFMFLNDVLSWSICCRFPVQNDLIAFLHIYFQFNFDGRFVFNSVIVGKLYISRVALAEDLQKKLYGLFIFIINALMLSLLQFNMLCRKLSCRLWISASIGMAPINK